MEGAFWARKAGEAKTRCPSCRYVYRLGRRRISEAGAWLLSHRATVPVITFCVSALLYAVLFLFAYGAICPRMDGKQAAFGSGHHGVVFRGGVLDGLLIALALFALLGCALMALGGAMRGWQFPDGGGGPNPLPAIAIIVVVGGVVGVVATVHVAVTKLVACCGRGNVRVIVLDQRDDVRDGGRR